MTSSRHSFAAAVEKAVTDSLAALSAFCRHHARAVLALAALATVVGGGYTASALRIDTSTLDMLSKELPFRQNHAALDAAFPQDYRQIIVVVEAATDRQAAVAAECLAAAMRAGRRHIAQVFYPDAHPFFARNGFLYLEVDELERLIDQLAEAQPLLASIGADTTLRGLADILALALGRNAGTEDPALSRLVGRVAETAAAVDAGEAAGLDWRQVLGAPGSGAAGGGTGAVSRRLLFVEPLLDFSAIQPAEAAIGEIRDSVATLGFPPGVVRVRLTGDPVMMAEELESVQSGMGVVGLVSFVLVFILLWLGLRSKAMVAATVVTLIVGLVLTATFATLAVGALNLISVAFAVLFIGLSVDFSIHLTLRAQELIQSKVPRRVAYDEAAASVGGSILLSALAAAVGFLAFLPTDYRGLSELGLIAGVGMLIASGLTLTVVPAMLTVFPPTPRQRVPRHPIWRARFQRLVNANAKTILGVAALLAVAATAALPFARFDESPLNLRDPAAPSMQALTDLLEDPRIDPFRALVLAPSLGEARTLRERLLALPEVAEVRTVAQYVPDDQDIKLDLIADAALFLAPASDRSARPEQPVSADARRAAIEHLQSAASVAGEQGDAAAARLARVLAEADYTDAELAALETALIGDLPMLLDRLSTGLGAEPVATEDLPAAIVARMVTPDGRYLVEVFPAADLRIQENRRAFAAAVSLVAPTASGEAIIVTEAGQAVVEALWLAGVISALAVVALLLLVLRSVVDAVSILVPLSLAGLLTVAVSVVAGEPFNFANVIVVPLLFGLGVASGIHLVVRDRHGGARLALESSTARAVVFSALTTLGSFGALSLSVHPGTASMGKLLAVAIVLTTLSMVIVLPALRRVGLRDRAANR